MVKEREREMEKDIEREGERDQSELGVLKGKGMTSKTGKTKPCNYCVVKCKVLLDCPVFSCLLGEAKAGAKEDHTLLVAGAEGLLTTHTCAHTRTHTRATFTGKWKLPDPPPLVITMK